MKRNFTSRTLSVNVSRGNTDNQLVLSIDSDYSNSQHKGRIHVDGKRLAETVERFWKSIKTKKLLRIGVGFDHIDWYISEVDIYTTPNVYIERGLKKARITAREHGSLPKDWSFNFLAKFADTTTVTPVLEVVKAALGSLFTPKMEKEFKKVMKPVLQKKTNYCNVYGEERE
jgi:hypothetical protein